MFDELMHLKKSIGSGKVSLIAQFFGFVLGGMILGIACFVAVIVAAFSSSSLLPAIAVGLASVGMIAYGFSCPIRAVSVQDDLLYPVVN